MSALKIVICDDDVREAETTTALVEEYIALRSLTWSASVYTSAAALMEEMPRADVYLLDIIMPGIDGIALGMCLRDRYPEAAIIYLTSSSDYAVDAFSVHAFSYLLKPVERKRLFSELDACAARRERRHCALEVRRGDNTVTETVYMDDVISVEYSNHCLIYRLTGGRQLTSGYKRGSFESIAGLFHATPSFLKISTSFIINLYHVRQLAGDSFAMSDGSSYRITRKYTEAKKKYLDFILG